ncbi:hypothetical protein UCDDS831_g08547 [Diplodia seriata]|uniref:Uncharacterized protein n=1 Tax=Diplodia seriata TaxID=420778 RepID=A0A0G2DSQ3_9PEZI|nr:hypothetical protein UCDDS831_g08547 [Diplodia seriata]
MSRSVDYCPNSHASSTGDDRDAQHQHRISHMKRHDSVLDGDSPSPSSSSSSSSSDPPAPPPAAQEGGISVGASRRKNKNKNKNKKTAAAAAAVLPLDRPPPWLAADAPPLPLPPVRFVRPFGHDMGRRLLDDDDDDDDDDDVMRFRVSGAVRFTCGKRMPEGSCGGEEEEEEEEEEGEEATYGKARESAAWVEYDPTFDQLVDDIMRLHDSFRRQLSLPLMDPDHDDSPPRSPPAEEDWDADDEWDPEDERQHEEYARDLLGAAYEANRRETEPAPVDPGGPREGGPEASFDWHRQGGSRWWRNEESDSDSDPGIVIRLPPNW